MSRRPNSGAPLLLGCLLLALGATGAAADDATMPPDASTVSDGVVVYYFHGNARCATCRTIESLANDAIHAGFAGELDDGTLTWQTVNIDEHDNTHFIQDFQLVTRSVVLAEYRDGAVVRFTNLDKVWQLVRSKDDFVAYVQRETREFLGAD